MLRTGQRRDAAMARLGFLAASLDALPSEVAVVDSQGDIVLVNEAWRAFGERNGLTTPGSCLGTSYLAACDVANEDGAIALAAQQGIRDVVLGRRETFTLEYPCHAPDAKRWFRLHVSAFTLDGERYVVTTHDDITARYVSEAILRAHEAELAAFNVALSHDPRGPLRRIDALAAETQDARAADLIQAETRRARDLVAAMIDMSRVSSATLDLQDVDLSRLATQVAAKIDRALEGHRVDWSIAPGLRARGDPALLRFLLENLMHNAWKFTRGSAHPRVEVTRDVDPAGRDAFVVRDNGVGFAPDDVTWLFRSFQRLANERESAGTGLGLATVSRIVERHGGRVWATGAPGEGAAFWFTLPQA